MIARVNDPHKPVAAGLFGVQHEPAKPQRPACPLETARAFAQLFATSEGGDFCPLDPSSGQCLA